MPRCSRPSSLNIKPSGLSKGLTGTGHVEVKQPLPTRDRMPRGPFVTEAAARGHLTSNTCSAAVDYRRPAPVQVPPAAELQRSVSAGHRPVLQRIVRPIGYMAPNGSFGHAGPT